MASTALDNNQGKLKSILKSASQAGKIGASIKKPPLKKQVVLDEEKDAAPMIKFIPEDNNLTGMSRNQKELNFKKQNSGPLTQEPPYGMKKISSLMVIRNAKSNPQRNLTSTSV